jgi:multiple sugar transport system substrate-binding protein
MRETRLKAITGMVLTLLLTGMLALTVDIQPVKTEPVTITVIGPWAGVERDVFLSVLQAFENQTGISINYTFYRAEDLATLLPPQFEAGTTPGDVIFMWSWWIKEKGQEGHILDVTGLIDEANFSAGALDPVKVGCKLYGGAYTGKVKPGFWYRKSFFSAHNLTEPTTWTEFLTLLDNIAAVPGIVNPILSGDGVGWPLSDITEHFLATFGGPELHRNLTVGTVAWNSSEVRAIFADRLVPLLQGNFSDPIEWTTALNLWWNGDYGLYFMGSWITGMVENASDLGIIPLPGCEALVLPADYFFIPAYTEHPEEAKELFKFLASEEAQSIQVAAGGYIATNLGVPLDAYPAVDRIVANLTAGKELLLDLDDTIGGTFQTTFWDQLKLLWVSPGQLDNVLAAIQAVAPSPPSDTTRPVITVLSPENRTYATSSVPLTFTVSECTSWMGYSLDGQANVTTSENTNLTSLLDGTHYVVVYANDTSGNMGTSTTVYFTVDTAPPNITDVSQIPPENNVLPEDVVRVNATVTDYVSEVKRVILNYTNGNGTWITVNMTNLQGNIWNATIPAFPYGTNITYVIIAEDNANNTITTEDQGYLFQYQVIPEFPAAIILSLFMITTLVTIILGKTILSRKQPKENADLNTAHKACA